MRIGALTIGHSPRQDLLRLIQVCQPDAEIVDIGALDLIHDYDVPAGMTDPTDVLTTYLRDGSTATLDRSFLTPLMQQAIYTLENANTDVIISLSSGDFPSLRSTIPLIKPFTTTCAQLRAMQARRIAVAVPVPEQEDTSRLKWAAHGFDTTVWVIPEGLPTAQVGGWLHELTYAPVPFDAIIIDDVRYTLADYGVPADTPNILDVGEIGMAIMEQMLAPA